MVTERPTSTASDAGTPVRVWDLPTRVFHWLLAATVVAAIVTAEIGGNWMTWHLRLGYLAISLLAFRWIWGFVGGHWSRFAQFPPSPTRALAYMRGQAPAGAGHNPLGALSVWAMLVLLTAQVASGLFADDEIATTGPLNHLVSDKVAGRLTAWHADIGGTAIIALAVLHVVAIVVHVRLRGHDLLGPMLRGDAERPAGTPPSRDGAAQRLAALAWWAACGAGVAALLAWAGR